MIRDQIDLEESETCGPETLEPFLKAPRGTEIQKLVKKKKSLNFKILKVKSHEY